MSSDTVDYFMSLPDGANYVVLYQMLCLKTINTEGRLARQIGEIIIPYDVEKIQRDCKWFSTDTVRVALQLYQSFGLIYEDQDGTLALADHSNLVGSETDWAAQKRRQTGGKNSPALPPGTVESTMENFHTEKEIDIRDRVREVDTTINSNNINKTTTQKQKDKKADIFEAFASGDAALLSALRDFEKMRKTIKSPMSDAAKKKLITDLKKFNREEWIPILEQSIFYDWKGVYALKQETTTWNSQTQSQGTRRKAQSGVAYGQCAGEGEPDYFERLATEQLMERMKKAKEKGELDDES